MIFSPRYRFRCDIQIESFMKWENGELCIVKYGKSRKRPKKQIRVWKLNPVRIPLPYGRIVHQLTLEIQHGKADKAHESLRRLTYAERVLDALGDELTRYKGEPGSFRSGVLTPILQRQLRGVPDTYAPSIRRAISPFAPLPTIGQVTTFYLGNDPLDPRCIPSYRRNLVYIREAMWHLGILMGVVKVDSKEDFENSLAVNDIVMEMLRTTARPPSQGIPPLAEVEIVVILSAGLEGFFKRELDRMVCIPEATHGATLLIILPIARAC